MDRAIGLEISKLKLLSCAIAMRHSSLYRWQRFSGGESRHKQNGLLQKTDKIITCKNFDIVSEPVGQWFESTLSDCNFNYHGRKKKFRKNIKGNL